MGSRTGDYTFAMEMTEAWPKRDGDVDGRDLMGPSRIMEQELSEEMPRVLGFEQIRL